MHIAQSSTFGRSLDPLREMGTEHEDLKSWVRLVETALFYSDSEESEFDLAMVERFLDHRLPSHFTFEDYVVFPMLLEIKSDPMFRASIRDLQADHGRLLLDARMLVDRMQKYRQGDPNVTPTELRALGTRFNRALLNHSAREDAIVNPVLRAHADQFELPEDLPLLPE